jgi:hypothetical protein
MEFGSSRNVVRVSASASSQRLIITRAAALLLCCNIWLERQSFVILLQSLLRPAEVGIDDCQAEPRLHESRIQPDSLGKMLLREFVFALGPGVKTAIEFFGGRFGNFMRKATGGNQAA